MDIPAKIGSVRKKARCIYSHLHTQAQHGALYFSQRAFFLTQIKGKAAWGRSPCRAFQPFSF